MLAASQESNSDTQLSSFINIPAGTYTPNAGTIGYDFQSNVHLRTIGGAVTLDGNDEVLTVLKIETSSGRRSASIDNLIIENGHNVANTVIVYAGGLRIVNTDLTITNSVIRNNATRKGGSTAFGAEAGLSFDGSNHSITVKDTIFSNNSFTNLSGNTNLHGAGAFVVAQKCNFESVSFTNNVGYYLGGGLYSSCSQNLDIDQGTFTGNSLSHGLSKGGGLAIMSTSNITLNNIELSTNTAVYGSAIHFDGVGSSEITNSSIHQNNGSNAINSVAGSTINLENTSLHEPSNIIRARGNSTINLTHVTLSSGTIYSEDGTTTISFKNSILASADGLNCNLGGGDTITSLGYNVSADSSGDCAFTQTGDINSTGTTFASVIPANNGGQTSSIVLAPAQSAEALVPLSQCSSKDQRSFNRPLSGGDLNCDAGATEI